MNVSLDKKDDLNAVLTVELQPEDYKPKVEENLKSYRKRANIPGFRPGMAPMGMIRKMAGTSILADEINKLASSALYDYLKENKIDILGQPLNSEAKDSELDFENGENFVLHFDLGLTPEFEIKFSKKNKLTRYVINVDDKEVDKEIENLSKRYGSLEVVEKTEEDKDSLSGTLTELDGKGNTLEGGVEGKTTTVLLEMIKDKKTRTALLGKKIGDEVDVDVFKLFNDNENVMTSTLGLPAEGIKDLNKKFRFNITEVKRFNPSPIDQSLFDKVFGEGEIETEEIFREKIKENLENYYRSETEHHVNHEVQHLIQDKHDFELPDEFLKRWLQQSYPDTYTEESTDEQYAKEANGLRVQLVKEKLLEDNNVELTSDEINQTSLGYTANMLRQYGMQNPDFDTVREFEQRNKGDENYMRQVRDIAVTNRVTEIIKDMIKIEEKEVTADKFYEILQKHNEQHNH